MLVDEVEPEEAVAVESAGVTETGEKMPWSGDGEKKQCAGEGLQVSNAVQIVCEQEVDESCAEEEDKRDETFGKHGESEGGPHRVGSPLGCRGELEGTEEEVKGSAEKQGEQDLRDEDAGKEKDAG